ncbi:sulfhydryl oxidase 2-like [Leptopilina heterotoma]|uniref:sulfhydryl oxidase 2-like n=1 Tax=Leptopilina heterotoma TaxID=63436 RepID=UPI001CA9C192|nr:sulfhydryl oxidase 2-like [Leptopilina heterotoma]
MNLKIIKHLNLILFIQALFLLFAAKNVNSLSNNSLLLPSNYEGLYYPSDNVVILNISNFQSSVYNCNSSWIVEFYSHWCGHCIRFSPLWKTVGKNLQNWNKAVQIAVIDCADDENSPICRDNHVISYPTLKYFSANSKPGTFGSDVKDVKDVAVLETIILNLVEVEERAGRGSSWPNILPYSAEDLKNIWKSVAENVKYITLVTESPDSIIGTSMIMNFQNVKELHIGRVLANTTNTTITLSFLQRDKTETTLKINNATTDIIEKTIKDKLEAQGVHVVLPDTKKDTEIKEVPTISKEQMANLEYAHKAGDVVFQLDIERALRYSLNHEVAMSENIDGEKMEALKNYINVLVSYFPKKNNGIRYLLSLKELLKNRSSITGESFRKFSTAFAKQLSPVFTGKDEWIGCQGSLNFRRGFPCGMWTMFHTLTVNFANMNNIQKQDDPAQVLKAMHGYIKSFFGCRWCKKHFVEMSAERHLFDVKGFDESILWLWRAHNQVNKRLAGDVTEDPMHKKIQYPTATDCPSCRDGNDTWIESNVLSYLKNKYSYSAINFYESALKTNNLHYIGKDVPYLYFSRK